MRLQDREPVRVRVVRQIRLLDQQRPGRGENPPGVRDEVLAVPLGDGEDHVLHPQGKRGLLQPLPRQRAVLDRVVQPGGRPLLLAAAPDPYAIGHRGQMFRVRAPRLVGLRRWASRAIASTWDSVRSGLVMGPTVPPWSDISTGQQMHPKSFGKLITDDSLTHS